MNQIELEKYIEILESTEDFELVKKIRNYIFQNASNRIKNENISEDQFFMIYSKIELWTVKNFCELENQKINKRNVREFYKQAREFIKNNRDDLVKLDYNSKTKLLKMNHDVAQILEDAALINLSKYFFMYRLINSVGYLVSKLNKT